MIYFCFTGTLTTIRSLIPRGADGRTTDNSGASPMYYAAWSGHLEIVHFLYALSILMSPLG